MVCSLLYAEQVFCSEVDVFTVQVSGDGPEAAINFDLTRVQCLARYFHQTNVRLLSPYFDSLKHQSFLLVKLHVFKKKCYFDTLAFEWQSLVIFDLDLLFYSFFFTSAMIVSGLMFKDVTTICSYFTI